MLDKAAVSRVVSSWQKEEVSKTTQISLTGREASTLLVSSAPFIWIHLKPPDNF